MLKHFRRKYQTSTTREVFKMIGIIDSGIGGKGIEKEIRKLLPKTEIIYFGDSKNFPYGDKDIKTLNKILENNINLLLKKGVKIIILACNSATTSSIKYLRKKFSIPIVGVEPAIKPASEITKTRNIAIFSTPVTAKGGATENLIKKYCTGIMVYNIAFPNLASLIENQTKNATYEVSECWSNYKNKNIDVVVLGCTHYTLIKKDIQKIVGRNVKIIDSNVAVARQVKKIYNQYV